MTSADKGETPTPAELPLLKTARVFDWNDPLTKFGVYVSAAWTVVSIVSLWVFADWSKTLSPNEWGDLAAGIAAPLAFFWLVLGFLQQGKELRLSTSALMLQVEELRNTVKHQADLVQVTRDQVEVQRQQDERERRARHLALQPDFFLSWIRSAGELSVKVINRGATVRNVRVEFLGSRHFSEIETGKERLFKIILPTDQSKPMAGAIHFTDADDGRWKTTFVATLTAEGVAFVIDAKSVSSD